MMRGYFTRFLGLSLVIAVLTALPIAAYAADGLDTTSTGLPLHFSVGGTQVMTLTTTGLGINIGTANPNASLDVNGMIKVGSTAAACKSSILEGALRYNTTTHNIEFCNHSDQWQQLGGGSPCYTTGNAGLPVNEPPPYATGMGGWSLGAMNYQMDAMGNPPPASIVIPMECPSGCPAGSFVVQGSTDPQWYGTPSVQTMLISGASSYGAVYTPAVYQYCDAP